MVVVELGTHTTETRFAHVSRTARAHVLGWWHPCRSAGASHVGIVRGTLNSLAIVNFGHSANTSRSQSWILIAVSPAIDCSLDQAALSSEAGIQFGQSPTDCVALSFVDQAVASVLVLAAAGSGVNTILGLELWAQSLNIYRFHVASDGIFHLYAIA